MKIRLVILLLSLSFIGKAQTICDSLLGPYFQFEYKQDSNYSSFDFNLDTIEFYQEKKMPYYLILNLNCKDSSFSMYYATEINTNDGDETYIISASPDNDHGIWKYDSTFKTISFKLHSTNTWKKFRIETRVNKKYNPNLSYYSDENYRDMIRLIAIKN